MREMSLVEDDGMVNDSQRVRDAREVVAVFEIAYADWKALGDSNCDPRPRGLERFDRGMLSRTSIYTFFQWGSFDRLCPHAHRAERRRSSWHSKGLLSRTRSARGFTKPAPLETRETR